MLRLSLKAVRTGRRKLGRRWGVVRLTYSRRPPFWSRRDSVYPCRRRVGLSCTLGQGTAAPGVGGGRDRGETGGRRQARSAHVVGGLSPKVGYADCKPWDGMCAGCGSAWRSQSASRRSSEPRFLAARPRESKAVDLETQFQKIRRDMFGRDSNPMNFTQANRTRSSSITYILLIEQT